MLEIGLGHSPLPEREVGAQFRVRGNKLLTHAENIILIARALLSAVIPGERRETRDPLVSREGGSSLGLRHGAL